MYLTKVPWSGADPEAMIQLGCDKNSWRAELIREREKRAILDNKTRSTIFRARMRLTVVETAVSVIRDSSLRPHDHVKLRYKGRSIQYCYMNFKL
jgi:hypothetical protein